MRDYFAHQDHPIQQNLNSTNNESHMHLTRYMYSKDDTWLNPKRDTYLPHQSNNVSYLFKSFEDNRD